MTYATAIAVVFLVVSLVNLTIQGVSLGCLTSLSATGPVEKRLLHTVACRVIAALTYVGLGVSALIKPPATGTIALTVSSAMLVMWWVNSAADVRLRRRMGQLDSGELPARLPAPARADCEDGKVLPHRRPRRASS